MSDALSRSIKAFADATPEQDPSTVGAAEFFGVAYEDVTQQQRASWKWATMHARQPAPTKPEPNPEHLTLRDAILTKWPALRSFFAEGKVTP